MRRQDYGINQAQLRYDARIQELEAELKAKDSKVSELESALREIVKLGSGWIEGQDTPEATAPYVISQTRLLARNALGELHPALAAEMEARKALVPTNALPQDGKTVEPCKERSELMNEAIEAAISALPDTEVQP